MLDICLIGTGGTMPLVNRWLTSLMVRYQGHYLLIDCGEGTQIAAQRAGLSLKSIETLLLTHLHADHISGLPGLLLTMGNMGKTETLKIYGPRGTKDAVKALTIIAQGLPFPIEITELEGDTSQFSFYECQVNAFRVQHRVSC
ncbi:MAG: MBL fold metallo-hydrolase, partial [Akkermansia sp.]